MTLLPNNLKELYCEKNKQTIQEEEKDNRCIIEVREPNTNEEEPKTNEEEPKTNEELKNKCSMSSGSPYSN